MHARSTNRISPLHRGLAFLFTMVVVAAVLPAPVAGQPAPAVDIPPQIQWRLVNNFLLMKHPDDLAPHRAAFEAARKEGGRDIIRRMEYRLQQDAGRKGWAARLQTQPGFREHTSLCLLKTSQGWKVDADCREDGTYTDYLYPRSYAAAFTLAPSQGECRWSLNDSFFSDWVPCSAEITIALPTEQSVTIAAQQRDDENAEEAPPIARTEVTVRDVVIAGIGDSIASGEGNPDTPVDLVNKGFCFERYASSSQHLFAPARSTYGLPGGTACPNPRDADQRWKDRNAMRAIHPAGWLDPACHRSAYGNQFRTAFALALANPQVAFIYLPLGCTGATIREGILGPKTPREHYKMPGVTYQYTVPSQISEINRLLAGKPANRQPRKLDLVLLTVGANDAGFSELVANVLFDPETKEFSVVRAANQILTPADARDKVRKDLIKDFGALRENLGRLVVDGDMSRVVFISYPNPGFAGGSICPSGRRGFDIHPAFSPARSRLQAAVDFVEAPDSEAGLLSTFKGLARCTIQSCPSKQRMTVVDGHQPAFKDHGYCAASASDPQFDRTCLKSNGKTFRGANSTGDERAFSTSGCAPSQFRPYAKRARWIRTPIDAYLSATTLPAAGTWLNTSPSNPHDAFWGITIPLYSGAIHPTAEGHAAIADATVPVASEILGVEWPGGDEEIVVVEPMQP
ncbi:hypothetical protein [Amorphus sp. MBR-141]